MIMMSVYDSLGVQSLDVAFDPLMMKEAGDSVTAQVRLASGSISEEMCSCLFY